MLEVVVATFLAFWLLGPIWWAVLIVGFGLLVVCSEAEKPGFAVCVLIIAVTLLWLTGQANFAAWAWNHPFELAYKVVGWFAIGALWAGFKFDRLGRAKAEEYLYAKKQYPGNRTDRVLDPAGGRTPGGEQKTIEQDTGIPKVNIQEYIPVALENKHVITNWIVLWPFSVFWYVCSEFIQSVVDFIVRHFGKIYDQLAARHFKNLQ